MDESGVAEAYRLYGAAIWRRCVGMLGNEPEASDVAQETFIRCLRHRHGLRPGRELLGWLHRVATNLCLNRLRDQKARGDNWRPETTMQDPPSLESAAAARLIIAEVLDHVDRSTQELAVYVFVDGMTHAEAAEVAGCSERTVRNRLGRFLERGRRVIGIRTQEGS
jgi:RNA polymerase sigma-70 factor (ECF subfamily)